MQYDELSHHFTAITEYKINIRSRVLPAEIIDFADYGISGAWVYV